jgi:hypothetical protein
LKSKASRTRKAKLQEKQSFKKSKAFLARTRKAKLQEKQSFSS